MLRRHLPLLVLFPASVQAQGTAPLPVVASFSILGDLAREVGGSRVQVTTLAGPDTDAHHFQPRPSHAEAVRRARVAIRNGWGFDAWFDRLLRSTNFAGPLVTATEGITPLANQPGSGHGHGPRDPHAWQVPANAARYAANIAEALSRADPAGAAAYAQARADFAAAMARLDAWIREQLAPIPEARRVVVTSHDAFAYFGSAYGVRFLAPQGLAKEAEPSAQQVAALIRRIRSEGITAVFIENMTNPATLNRLAAEAGVRVRGRLYADALSGPEGPAATYDAMMRHNVALLAAAMRG